MAQHCFASISDTELHCAWCVTRYIVEDGVELSQAFCEKHNKPCMDMKYYCASFIGYKPDWRMSDDEEKEMVEILRRKNK